MRLKYKVFGSGQPVVLLHAFPLSGAMWMPNIDPLISSDFRVVVPDLRGFGDSRGGDEVFSIEEMARDVAALMDDLGIGAAFIGGLSMGGYVTLNLYRLFPEKFMGLILCDTNPDDEAEENRNRRYEMVERIRAAGSRALVENLLPNLISDNTKASAPELVGELEERFRECSPASAMAAMRGMAVRKDHNYLLGDISVPTLLMFGEADKITNLERAKEMSRAIPNSRLVEIPGAGHYSNLENPEAFNSAMVEFLEQNRP